MYGLAMRSLILLFSAALLHDSEFIYMMHLAATLTHQYRTGYLKLTYVVVSSVYVMGRCHPATHVNYLAVAIQQTRLRPPKNLH